MAKLMNGNLNLLSPFISIGIETRRRKTANFIALWFWFYQVLMVFCTLHGFVYNHRVGIVGSVGYRS